MEIPKPNLDPENVRALIESMREDVDEEGHEAHWKSLGYVELSDGTLVQVQIGVIKDPLDWICKDHWKYWMYNRVDRVPTRAEVWPEVEGISENGMISVKRNQANTIVLIEDVENVKAAVQLMRKITRMHDVYKYGWVGDLPYEPNNYYPAFVDLILGADLPEPDYYLYQRNYLPLAAVYEDKKQMFIFAPRTDCELLGGNCEVFD